MKRIINDTLAAIIIAALTGLILALGLNDGLERHNYKLQDNPLDVYFNTYTNN